jgi:DMSO/TMAO reductase YedYZ heme-binding membrane subunit
MDLLSTWNVIKSAGFTSYLLLFLAVILSAFSYGKHIPAKIRTVLLPIHQATGRLGFFFGLLHGIVLTIDSYKPFALSEVFIPFMASGHPWIYGFGTISLIFMFVVLVTSDWLKTFGRKVWRTLHYLAFPAFVLAFAHGLLGGTNSDDDWARVFYAVTAVGFLLIVIVRAIVSNKINQVKGNVRHEYPAGGRR